MEGRPQSLKVKEEATSIDLIDLCTPTPTVEHREEIAHRLPVLACFPTSQDDAQPLLANLPPERLTSMELRQRLASDYPSAMRVVDVHPKIPSLLREKYRLLFGDLMDRLKVDLSILDYNYTRLNTFLQRLTSEAMRVFDLRPENLPIVPENEYPYLLEFFLQFDLHLFYMKTCSFRFARPRTLQEGLFCVREPEARYDLSACGNCALCCPKYSLKYRSKPFIVEFNQGHRHRFVHGYEAILNASASCHTRNIIYCLTCPCGQVDYVGATAQSLHDRLKHHREHGNRIMHEFLLGQENILRAPSKTKTGEVLRKDRMKLYQHSARCPVAMQIFLDANPQYWRFVPMPMEESMQPEECQIQRPVLSDEVNRQYRTKEDALACIEAVPTPPSGYAFSNRQLVLQTKYFHQKCDQQKPNLDIDLYQATIVAVLPEPCTDIFRDIIESLFITHGETSLNTFGNVLIEPPTHEHHPMHNPWLLRGSDWCQGLLRRPKPQ